MSWYLMHPEYIAMEIYFDIAALINAFKLLEEQNFII